MPPPMNVAPFAAAPRSTGAPLAIIMFPDPPPFPIIIGCPTIWGLPPIAPPPSCLICCIPPDPPDVPSICCIWPRLG